MSSTTVRTAHATRTARASHRAAAARVRRRAVVRSLTLPAAGPASVRTGTRLTRRGRLVVVLGLVALLFAAFSLGRTGTQAATAPAPAPAVVQTTVQPGETLWAVATRIAPEADPRDVVQQLAELNDLRGSGLQAGQQLLLPA